MPVLLVNVSRRQAVPSNISINHIFIPPNKALSISTPKNNIQIHNRSIHSPTVHTQSCNTTQCCVNVISHKPTQSCHLKIHVYLYKRLSRKRDGMAFPPPFSHQTGRRRRRRRCHNLRQNVKIHLIFPLPKPALAVWSGSFFFLWQSTHCYGPAIAFHLVLALDVFKHNTPFPAAHVTCYSTTYRRLTGEFMVSTATCAEVICLATLCGKH
jgi:hypothetical protein